MRGRASAVGWSYAPTCFAREDDVVPDRELIDQTEDDVGVIGDTNTIASAFHRANLLRASSRPQLPKLLSTTCHAGYVMGRLPARLPALPLATRTLSKISLPGALPTCMMLSQVI